MFGGFNIQQATASLEEMVAILVVLETDHVCAEDTFEKFGSDRKAAEDFRGWERGVQKESNLGFW